MIAAGLKSIEAFAAGVLTLGIEIQIEVEVEVEVTLAHVSTPRVSAPPLAFAWPELRSRIGAT